MREWLAKFFPDKASAPDETSRVPAGYYCPLSATELLSTEERSRMLARIWENTSLPKEAYQSLCLEPLRGCAEVMQQFPYSNAGTHACLGGMLDATLKTVLFAVMKARSYMLPPGVPPEDQARDSAAWNTVVFYAALFSHLAVLGSLKVELDDGAVWTPFDGKPASAYRFRFVQDALPHSGMCQGALFAARLLPDGVFAWLKQHPPALDMLVLWVGGQRAQCGVINAIVSDAIREVVEQASVPELSPLIGVSVVPNPSLLVSAIQPAVGLQHDGVPVPPVAPVVLASALKSSAVDGTENQPEPVVSQEVNADDADWGDVAAYLGYETQLQESEEPSVNVVEPVHPADTASPGEAFWTWLLTAVADASLPVNAADARVHLVAGNVFIQAPEIFHQFAVVAGGIDDMKALRQAVEALPHVRRREGKLYRCRLYAEVKGEGAFTDLAGYFVDARRVYGQQAIPGDNPLIAVPKRK